MSRLRATSRKSSVHGQDMRRVELTSASPFKLRLAATVAGNGAGRVIGVITAKQIRHRGLWFDTRSADFTPRVRAQMFWGIYEGAETRMIRTFLRGSTTVVELGSSLGITAAHVASVMAPGGQLICVEANPNLVAGLRERTRWRLANVRVDVVHAAVADYCGDAALFIADQTVGSRLHPDSQPNESTVCVPALTLREILRQQELTDFDLVSDIEGAEVAFLLQDPSVLLTCRRAIIELHDTVYCGRPISVFDLVDAAVAAGLQVVGRHGPVVALTRP
jgi:FkbM family methyltransferase